jgi:hypothetical protein
LPASTWPTVKLAIVNVGKLMTRPDSSILSPEQLSALAHSLTNTKKERWLMKPWKNSIAPSFFPSYIHCRHCVWNWETPWRWWMAKGGENRAKIGTLSQQYATLQCLKSLRGWKMVVPTCVRRANNPCARLRSGSYPPVSY